MKNAKGNIEKAKKKKKKLVSFSLGNSQVTENLLRDAKRQLMRSITGEL